jgi:aspartyl protease family protein
MWRRNFGAAGSAVGVVTTALFVSIFFEPMAAKPGFKDLRGTIDAQTGAFSVTELKADERGHFVTDAEIDRTSIRVLIDTGATAVVMSYEDAEKAGLRPHLLDYDVPVSTANGLAKAAKVTLDRVEVQGVTVRGVDGLVLPQGTMDGTLLGMSFLSRLRSFKVEDGVLEMKD